MEVIQVKDRLIEKISELNDQQTETLGEVIPFFLEFIRTKPAPDPDDDKCVAILKDKFSSRFPNVDMNLLAKLVEILEIQKSEQLDESRQ